MKRRTFLTWIAKAGAAASLGAVPLSRMADGLARTTQTVTGWVQVLGRTGDVIEVSPRFIANHPDDYLRIVREAASR